MEETLEVSVSKSGGDGTSGSLFLVLLIREIRKCVCGGGYISMSERESSILFVSDLHQ